MVAKGGDNKLYLTISRNSEIQDSGRKFMKLTKMKMRVDVYCRLKLLFASVT